MLHGKEKSVHADAGCQGLDKRDEIVKAQNKGELRKKIDWCIAARFKYRKVSYRGRAKNMARAQVHAARVNLYLARRALMAQGTGACAW